MTEQRKFSNKSIADSINGDIIYGGTSIHFNNISAATCSFCFVHGLGDTSNRFTRTIDYLTSKNYQCSWFDLPGCGENSRTGFSPDSVISVISSICDLFGPDSSRILVGHSFGGLLAALAASNKAGLRWSHILLIEASLTPVDQEFFRSVSAPPVGGGIGMLAQLCAENPTAAPRDYITALSTWQPDSFYACVEFAKTMVPYATKSILEGCSEVLYAYGRHSRGNERSQFLSAFPTLQLVEFSDSGHWPHVEEEERFFSILSDLAGGILT